AQIYAEGTADNPIIFTAEVDDTNDANDMFPEDRGLWGGLIILGNGILGDNTSEVGVEGIPAGETRALYGGNDDTDNSGVLRYVSIRHGGAELSPGDEINGLTLGGVGSGTVFEYIEIFANSDDGIEFFGGQPSIKWACVSFCGDDSYDWDTGFRGKGQFWFSLQGADDGDNGAEMDGAKPDDNARFAQPTIYNATYIGSGIGAAAKNEHALLFRDGTGGYYNNSIFTSFVGKAIQVEDLATGLDSRQRLENGELALNNNIWWEFGAGTSLTDIINPTTAGGDVSWLISHLGNNGNTLEDPQLGGISRDTDESLDPRPASNGPAFNALNSYDDAWFTPVYYKGAFCSQGVWIKGWTAISEYGILDSAVPAAPGACQTTSTDDFFKESNGFILAQNAPNPAVNQTTISFSTPSTANVSLVVMNAYGQVVKTVLDNTKLTAGDYNEVVNTTDMPAGIYFYSLRAENVVLTKSFMIQK
ncbi:MAG: T9SS type A sorting domain-containing protein, partial [Saprospiraceae bacterium]|nr:T9SS type A sorting domain-containing protein [Saprospiraceae bacterium]